MKMGKFFLFLGLLGISLGATLLTYQFFFYQSHFFPDTQIGDIDVSNLNATEATTKLAQNSPQAPEFNLILNFQEEKISSSAATLGLQVNVEQTVNQALTNNRRQKQHAFKYQLNSEKLNSWLEQIALKHNIPGHYPQVILKNNKINIDQGKIGYELDLVANTDLINQAIVDNNQDLELSLKINSKFQELTAEEIDFSQKRAEKLKHKVVNFTNNNYKDLKIILAGQELLALLKLPQGYSEEKIQSYLDKSNQKIKREPQNAEFVYQKQGNKITVDKFTPHQYGITLELIENQENLKGALQDLEEKAQEQTNIELLVSASKPEVILADLNDLGIKELIGFGESHYAHSIPNRVHNVALTTQKISGALVAPGQEFSFNKTLGEVSQATGYRPAYVISQGKTVLGDGGGVCQVSTTVFRAALNAGLNITLRKQHAYRVSYYELDQKPGVDATVYAGDTDLRFINDTDGWILIVGEADSKNLYMKMEIYGTSDGRTTEITNHKVWDASPALPTVYYPTYDLPSGVKQQIDWLVGGIKAEFTNVVKDKDGQVIREQKFFSNYRPWSAKYMVGI